MFYLEKKLTVNFCDGRTSTLSFQIPNFCPNCGKIVAPIVEHITTSNNSDDSHFSIGLLLRCSDENCNHYFELEYAGSNEMYGRNIDDHPVKQSIIPPIDDHLPAEIESVSPIFKKTYDQALKAELIGLDQIAGVGMRKSIEFLVKDYLVNVKGEEEQEIQNLNLSPAIKKIEFEKLHNLTLAATWIGNDETHYVKKWEDKDISDMKKFIRSASLFISADIDSSEASDMIN